MSRMVHGFNEATWECQMTVNVIMGTLIDDVQNRLKSVEDMLVSVTKKLKDQ